MRKNRGDECPADLGVIAWLMQRDRGDEVCRGARPGRAERSQFGFAMMMKMARSIVGSRRRWLAGCCLAALAAVLAGCGDKDTFDPTKTLTFYPAKGKVTLPDGKPMTSGRVIFVGTKNSVTSPAPIESDGSFHVQRHQGRIARRTLQGPHRGRRYSSPRRRRPRRSRPSSSTKMHRA